MVIPSIMAEYNTKTTEELLTLDMMVFRKIKEYRLQSMGEVGVHYIAELLNLQPFLDFFEDFNKSSNLPYHNRYHAYCVVLNCYEGYHYATLNPDNPPDPFIVDEVLRGLIAGALLHDFNHTGGLRTDEDNVNIALQGLRSAQQYATSKLLGLSSKSLEIAASIIKVTQYPFAHEPLMIPEMIIRDADLMQPYEENSAKLIKQYLGLKKEIELQKQTTYTFAEFATGVKHFQDTETVWYTKWAHEKAISRSWEKAKTKLMKKMSAMLNK